MQLTVRYGVMNIISLFWNLEQMECLGESKSKFNVPNVDRSYNYY